MNFIKKLKMQKKLFITQSQTPPLLITIEDVKVLFEYQKQLINTIVYGAYSAKEKNKIWGEIRGIENFTSEFHKKNYQL